MGGRDLDGARTVITGGAGFLGSHLCDHLLARGAEVVCVDNFLTGRAANVGHLGGRARFTFLERDVTDMLDIDGDVTHVLHFASPASPVDYLRLPIETLDVGSRGTFHALDLAQTKGARFLLASTSEVYGDPLVHPQPETYWGNVNPVGPRGVYDEAKRFGEALTTAYRQSRGVDTAIARIFNTFGPRMRPDDGRAIPTFITQALRGEPLTVAGDGGQTRSVCFVDDEVRGLVGLLLSGHPGPMNIGSAQETSVLALAELVVALSGSASRIEYVERPQDDPQVRRPDTTLVESVLGWRPEVTVGDGLAETIAWFRHHPELIRHR